jgi:cytochrome P450
MSCLFVTVTVAVTGHVTSMAGAKGVWNIAAFAEQYGPLFKMQLLGSVVVVLSDPQTISRVARKTGKNRHLSWSYHVFIIVLSTGKHCML